MPSTVPTQSEFEQATARISQLRQDFDQEIARINARVTALESGTPTPPPVPPPTTHLLLIDAGGPGGTRPGQPAWLPDPGGSVVDKTGTPIASHGIPWLWERYGSTIKYSFKTNGTGKVAIHTAEAWGPNIELGGRRFDIIVSDDFQGSRTLTVKPQDDFGPNKPGTYQLDFTGNFTLTLKGRPDSVDPAACLYGLEVTSSAPVERDGSVVPSPGPSPTPPPPPIVVPPPTGGGPTPGAVVVTQGNLDRINSPEIILRGDFTGLRHVPRPGQRIWLDGGKFNGNGQEFMFRALPGGWDVLGVPGTQAEVFNYGRPGSQRAVIDFKDPDWPKAGRYDVGKCGEVANFTIRDIKGEALHYGGVNGHFHHMQLLRSDGGVLVAGWGKGHVLEDSTLAGGGVVGSPGHESGDAKLFAGANYVVRRLTVKGATGPGLWFDGMCIDPIIEDVVVKDCTGPGIFLEIGFGGTVRRVTCERTNTNWGGAFGGAAFAISMNDETLLEDCVAKDSKQAVMVTYQPFRQAEFSHYPKYITDYAKRTQFSVKNVRIRNFVNDNSGGMGAGHDGGSPPSVLDTVRFENTTMRGNARWINKRPSWT